MVDSDFSVVSVVPVVPKKISDRRDPRDPRDPRDDSEHAPKGSSLPRLLVCLSACLLVCLSARQSSFFYPTKKQHPEGCCFAIYCLLCELQSAIYTVNLNSNRIVVT